MTDYRQHKLWEREMIFKDQHKDLPQGNYAILWEDPLGDEPAKVTRPSPTWLAMAMHGGILPPVEVYWALREDEEAHHKAALADLPSGATEAPAAKKNFRHTRGHLLHETPPVPAMTEEEAMEYLVMKDLPPRVWRDYKGNRSILKIVPVE